MAFDSSGTFHRAIVGGWQADALAGIKIVADRHDLEDDGFALGLSTCITKDGRTQPTANLPFNNKRLMNIADPEDGGDAVPKRYIDARLSEVLTITGIDDAGRITFAGSQSPLATGEPLGIEWTQADLFFGVKPVDVEKVGQVPRWVWNNKADGMGTDVANMTEAGALSINGVLETKAGVQIKMPGTSITWYDNPAEPTVAKARARITSDQTNNIMYFNTYNSAGTSVAQFRLSPTNGLYIDTPAAHAGQVFTEVNCPVYKSAAGYQKLANGWIIQWGAYGGSAGDGAVNFPAVFPSNVVNIQVTASGFTGGDMMAAGSTDAWSASAFAIRPRALYAGTGGTPQLPGGGVYYWVAIGY